MLQYIFLFLLIVITVISNIKLAKREQMPKGWSAHLQLLLFYHLGMVLIFSLYLSRHGGDSIGYWNLQGPLADPDAKSWGDYFGVGYPFMYWLNYLPSKVLGWSWWTGNVLYALLGYLGFRYLSLLLYRYFSSSPQFHGLPLLLVLLYFPNLHFWTAGVGKEALCFYAIAAVVYGLSKSGEHRYKLLVVIGLMLLFMTRTYLVAVMFLAMLVTLSLDLSKLSRKELWSLGLGILLLLMLMPVFLWYSGFRDWESIDIGRIITSQLANLGGEGAGSSVPMLAYGQLQRWLTYWFRPMLWEGTGQFFVFAAGVENTVNLILILVSFWYFKFQNWKKAPFFLRLIPVLFVLTAMLYANILGNLGIMMRMKSPFIVLFILFLAWMGTSGEKSATKSF